ANTLVKAVAGSEPEDIIHDTALFSLTAIGSQVFPAVRAYIRYGRNTQTKTSLAEVIGQIGRRERDAFDLLRSIWEHATWPQNRRSVALAFGDLKDRRAIPLLQAALSDSKADALDLDYVRWALEQLGVKTPSPQERPSHINLPAPHNPRLIYEGDTERILRLRYTPWGEPLCPDCGSPLVLHESGEWIHLQQRSTARSAAPATPRAKRRRRKRR
ncbi:MAG: hypothetical protein N2508_08440, partial [Anaerolineae bacterium]|nr:hypothetical protein [Anaerolineae bacterium]